MSPNLRCSSASTPRSRLGRFGWKQLGGEPGDVLVQRDVEQVDVAALAPQRLLDLAHTLVARYALPVEQVDERRSSIEAAQRFAAARAAGSKRRKQAAALDATAAVVILERWLRDPEARLALPPSENQEQA